MSAYPFTAADLEALRQWDTPTICNALELVLPERRGHGFTTTPMVCADPALPPICGLARTGVIRAAQPSLRGREHDRAVRIGWYEYVADAALPTIVVIEDLDPTPGVGAFWGEVHSAVHKALGAPGFQLIAGMVNPSHAWVHMVEFNLPVTVNGMRVEHDDVVHADRHGAVVIPAEVVRKVPAAIELGARREKVILDLCKDPEFSVARLREAISRADEIH
jgi:hypothetical protein